MNLLVLALVAAFMPGILRAADTVLEPAPRARLKSDLPLMLTEFRVYQAAPGKLDALHALIRDHQIPLLEHHGGFTQAVLVPAGENLDQSVYLITVCVAAGSPAFRADHTGADMRKADLDSSILELEVDRLHTPGVIEAEQTRIVRGECFHPGKLRHLDPRFDRPMPRKSPNNQRSAA